MEKLSRKGKSLRGQLFGLMSVIAIVECVVLILTVALSGVFTELDAEAYRFFSNDSAERALSLDSNTGRLIRNMTNAASVVSSDAQALADETGIPLSEAYMNDDLYDQIMQQFAEHLIEFLNGNSVSAAFCILEGSNNGRAKPDVHSAVYIRDSAPGVTGSDLKNLQLEVGPLAVAKDNKIAVATGWTLDMKIPEDSDNAYYANPIAACIEYPRSELVRYGYWSPPTVIIPNTRECISYTLPILDSAERPCGVMGFEISLSFFTSEYFSNTNLPYPGSFFAVTSGTSDEIDTRWVIPGSPTAEAYLPPGKAITLRPRSGTEVYETDIEGVGPVYCTVNELTMYSKNSPFVDERWLLTGMVGQSVLNETSSRIAALLLTTMAITLGVAFLAIFLLSFLSTRKIAALSRYVNEQEAGSDLQFIHTNLREIDELTAAIEQLNRRVNDSLKVTSKMMELTQLPLGGFEVSDEMGTVMVTEYIARLLDLKEGERISKEEWSSLFSELTSHPVDGYLDVYRYDANRMSAFHFGTGLALTDEDSEGKAEAEAEDLYRYAQEPEGRPKWLRIIEAPTENGTVGMILDATSDVDERMRLAHELDYDALTRLYNRNAFKREAFKKISMDPNRIGAVIFADLDNLKSTNDTYGHLMGDKLITTAADMFRECTKYGGIAARISGDEFAMFLYGYETQDEVREIIRKLYREFRKKHFKTPDGKTQWISCSSGIAWYPEDSRDVADLLKLSDYAMYEAKHNRKGTIVERDGKYLELNESSDSRSSDTLKTIIDERQFRFRFQPIVDLRSASIYGYEALMSVQSDAFESPKEVFDAARAQSLLGPLESALVLKILDVTKHDMDVIGDRKIFVNSIPGQQLDHRDWEIVRKEYTDVLPHIIMEVTEAENDDLDTMLIKLRRLRRMGIPIAIDNFGQGYSNEVRIIAMQPSIIKIDGTLIRNLPTDTEKQEIVSHLVDFAHAQGVKVSAECVELEAELECVAALGMDYAQGYLLGRPNFEFKPLSDPIQDLLDQIQDEYES